MEHEPTIARTIQRIAALGEAHARRGVAAALLAHTHYEQQAREQIMQQARHDQESNA